MEIIHDSKTPTQLHMHNPQLTYEQYPPQTKAKSEQIYGPYYHTFIKNQ